MNIDQLKQQLEEKDREIERLTKIDNKTFLFETYEKPLREQIQQLKQQLVEKQNKIDEISKEFVQVVHAIYDWRVLCAEKDKEIERLKNLFKLNNEVVINQGKEIFDLRVQVLQQKQNQTQLAIQELEKVKDNLYELYNEPNNNGKGNFWNSIDVIDIIDQQIKELKGD